MSDNTAPNGAERSRHVPESSEEVPESSEEVPEDEVDLLDWAFVGNVMANDRDYWVATAVEDGHPHTRPVTGVWVDDMFHCSASAETQWVQNLIENPSVTVHRQDAEKVAIIEGEAERLDDDDDDDHLERIDDAYEQKYDTRPDTPVFAIHPDRVLAWTEFPADATKWTFE